MKKQLLPIISFAVSLTVSGQQINQPTNCYRSYDELEKKQVTVKGFDLNSKNGVWSLENAEISQTTYNAEYSTETDTLMAVERGERTYYSQDRNTVCIIGTENYMELMSYDMPETWLQFPMQVGDSISGYFNATGEYCQRMFMRRFGTYMTKADAAGKMVTPEGDTLRNVTRLHTERYVGTIAVPIDTMKCKIPAFTVDSIVRHLAPDTAKVREDVYRWYAEGYRYPILEAKTVSYCGKNLTEEMFYCPPEMQEQLVLDEENKQVRARLAEKKQDSNSYANNGQDRNSGSDSFRYQINQNEDGKTITVNYSATGNTKVTAILANNMGYVYSRVSKSDGSAITLDYSGLRRGQYILYINANGEEYAEKFSVK